MKKWLSLTLALLTLCLAACESGGVQETGSSGESSAETSSEAPSGKKETVKLGKNDALEVRGINEIPTEAGVYVFTDPDFELPREGEYTDIAVVNSAVTMMGDAPYVPEDGIVVRFYECEVPETALGDTARYSGGMPVPLGDGYVSFGEEIHVRVGYTNTTRTEEAVGFLFDEGWYSDTTCSNQWGTEIAVQNGVVVEVNPSGTETSGNTKIPAGGFVLAVGAGSTYESILRKVKVGDAAAYITRPTTYSAEKFVSDLVDEDMGDALSAVSHDTRFALAPKGTNLTQVLVNKEGYVVSVETHSAGGGEIPKGGMAITAKGYKGDALASAAEVGKYVHLKNKTVTFIETPAIIAARLETQLAALEETYGERKDALAHIHYAEADAALKKAKEAFAALGDLPSREALLEAVSLADSARIACIPALTLQNREAWVTVGELNYDGSPLLHYTNEDTVRQAVRYAKRVGLNGLIIDNTAYGWAAYPSEIQGMVMHPDLQGFDVLEAFSRICKEEGVKLTVMVNGFSSAVASVEYPQEHFVNLYGEYLMVSKKGQKVDASGGQTLEPSYPQVQAFNLAVARELVTKYDFDGIQVDYIRYPLPIYYQVHNYEDFGYECPGSKGFEAKFGKDPKLLSITDSLWEDWCDYRRDIISGYAKAFYEAVKEAAPRVEVSFTCFAEYTDRQKYVYQDVEMWAEEGYADAIYPMIYGDNTEYQLGYAQQIHPVTEYADVVLGVGYYVRASSRSIMEQNYMPYSTDAIGVSGFTLRYISYCGYDKTLRECFREAAVPKGTEGTAQGCIAFLKKRVEDLSYLFPEDGLDLLAKGLAEAQPTVDGLQAAFDAVSIENGELKAALEKDLAYALRFLK
ncbi:MAG: family 10 glycosylhydrolase [Clostridia bacterium]|nr:family 10 glycosylhydrolase [Clostridia bacterium]